MIATLAAAVLSACVGQIQTSPHEVWMALSDFVFGSPPAAGTDDSVIYNTLWFVRFPRVVQAIVVGAGLGCAGALLQGIFANPLAEPGIIGVSAGAATAASAAMVYLASAGFSVTTTMALWGVSASAFAGGLAVTTIVYLIARRHGHTDIITLILTGVAINAFAGGLIAMFTFIASPTARDQIVFWQLGSLAGASWDALALMTPLTVLALCGSFFLYSRLDLLALGETQAQHLGVSVERLRMVAIVFVAVLVATGVAFSGIIAFVGLVVPHAIRLVIGPRHATLLPASAVGGALVLLIADTIARTLIPNADLPLGMLTSLIGGPVFLMLLLRARSSQGSWS